MRRAATFFPAFFFVSFVFFVVILLLPVFVAFSQPICIIGHPGV